MESREVVTDRFPYSDAALEESAITVCFPYVLELYYIIGVTVVSV